MIPTLLTACSKAEKEEAAASEAFAALETEYSEGMEALSEDQDSLPSMSEQPDSAERAAFMELLEARNLEFEALTESFVPRYEALSAEHWGTGAALEAEIWVMSRPSMPDPEEADEEAAKEAREARIAEYTDAIFEEYAETPHMEKLAASSYFFTDKQAEEYLGRLREDSPHANVRAAAIYYPASRKLSSLRFESMRAEFGMEEDAETAEETDPEEDTDPKAEIDADLQLLIDEYGDVPMEGSTYGTVAYAHLTAHTAEELAIGQPAPEIIGSNVDGEEMRLSQFLGKVVVIDFWGDW